MLVEIHNKSLMMSEVEKITKSLFSMHMTFNPFGIHVCNLSFVCLNGAQNLSHQYLFFIWNVVPPISNATFVYIPKFDKLMTRKFVRPCPYSILHLKMNLSEASNKLDCFDNYSFCVLCILDTYLDKFYKGTRRTLISCGLICPGLVNLETVCLWQCLCVYFDTWQNKFNSI